ncbi:hypothetical protein [Kribbella shirazensis]|jgi:hypothetical protein|uniref:Uncharacterized protein n=1 Tax=Kribbella shirazensis TaxID=1105143 RepID=A0A7X5VE01_9ACTN|nr:hypothetical protein [Kribbella shirazensis]NIK59041.1 hypothetical protein [Kribbella shirazensis]
MDTFTEELRQRIAAARGQLRAAQQTGDLDAERIYSGELDSLLRLALENDVIVPPETTADPV